jgi:ethanolamine kinase
MDDLLRIDRTLSVASDNLAQDVEEVVCEIFDREELRAKALLWHERKNVLNPMSANVKKSSTLGNTDEDRANGELPLSQLPCRIKFVRAKVLRGGLTNVLYVAKVCLSEIVDCDQESEHKSGEDEQECHQNTDNDDDNDVSDACARRLPREVKIRVNVRVFGAKSELLIDRDAERRALLLLNRLDKAPPLYAMLANGCVYGFVDGTVPDAEVLQSGVLDELIAREIGEWHGSDKLLGSLDNCFWLKLDGWAREAEKASDQFADVDVASGLRLLGTIKTLVERDPPRVVFSHNDLLPGNIVVAPDSQSIAFIDFEYASANFAPFDLANHLTESIIDYDAISADWSAYPGHERERAICAAYLRARDAPAVSTEANVDKLQRRLLYFGALSSLHWAFWAVIQATSSKKNFDYARFAQLRFDMAHERMSVLNSHEE